MLESEPVIAGLSIASIDRLLPSHRVAGKDEFVPWRAEIGAGKFAA
jgi:hypothetical protein